ncbi:MAG TPA: nicotinate-nucleotide--dimethylbenzimidazole phosphoribosyltransferase, partial [Dehalococcoidia bacterium]
METLRQTLERMGALDGAAMAAARARHDRLTKPPGSLGRLEDLAIWLAGVRGDPIPQVREKVIVVAAADHGVAAAGVSAYPQEVTGQMVLNFLAGGAAVTVLARHAGARVVVVDAGVAADLPERPDLRRVRLGPGTADFSRGPAMSREQAVRCLEEGIRLAREEAARGADVVAVGEMGIGNTTAASAVTAAVLGLPPRAVTGRGTGVTGERFQHKVAVIERALAVNRPDPSDPLDVLARVGGFEIGLLAGVMLGAAAERRPVVLDGFITGAAALLACGLAPALRDFMVAAHRSVEPGHQAILDHLGLE